MAHVLRIIHLGDVHLVGQLQYARINLPIAFQIKLALIINELTAKLLRVAFNVIIYMIPGENIRYLF